MKYLRMPSRMLLFEFRQSPVPRRKGVVGLFSFKKRDVSV